MGHSVPVQRKHIDVCRQCPDNEECDAFQAYIATEPPPPPPEPAETNIPICLLLQELGDIRELVADTRARQEMASSPRRKNMLSSNDLVALIRSELEGIRRLY
jgi:hypothetical protein